MKHIPIIKIDPLTGEKFISKKSSQRFASPANRIKYNNLRAKEFTDSLSHINKPLIKNYKILSELLSEVKQKTFHVQFLLGMGYNFSVITHYEKLKDIDHPCVFAFMIIKEDADNVKIIKND